MTTPTHSDVTVRLTETDGNVFAIIGAVNKALRRAGHEADASEFTASAMAAQSYDEVLQLVMSTVDVA